MSELQHANNDTMSGFGSHSAAEVEQLQKALGLGGQGGAFGTSGANPNANIVGNLSGYATDAPGTFSGGNALAVEDLDRTLKLVTFGLEHLRLWKDILKERVPQVVHEYNVQNAYGESDVSPFFQMGATPLETDAQYNRDVVQIKYLGTKGAVLHNLTLIQAAHGPVVAREVKNKTIELLARNERAMFSASSAIQAEEYDGLEYQIVSKARATAYQSAAFEGYGNNVSATDAAHILNAAGADFDEDIAEDAALIAVNNFGMPMDMYLGTDVHSAFSRAFYAKQRTVPGESLTSGNRVTEHMGTLDYRFKPSLFNRPKKNITAKIVAITANIAITAGTTDSTTARSVELVGVGGAGPVARSGILASATTVDFLAAQNTIAVNAGALYYELYVGAVNATDSTTLEFVKRLPLGALDNEAINSETFVAPPSVASGVRNDGNVVLSVSGGGLAKAFLIMHDPDVLCWKQLGSMIKYDLAVTTTQYEWLQLLYGTPLVMAPLKNVIIRNLKSDS